MVTPSTHEEKSFSLEKKKNKQELGFVELLKDCIRKKDICGGCNLHVDIVKQGLLERSPYIASCLISMYAKCGMLLKAKKVLEELPVRNVVIWNALISGFAHEGECDEAFFFFEMMQKEGHFPNSITFICILMACGSTRAIRKGEEIHGEITRGKFLEKSMVLGSALIDTYAKCGELTKAQLLFDELSVHNVVSWTSLIAGHAQLGKHDIVFELFHKMVGEGIKPNAVTFIVLLNSCSDAGLVNEGQLYFDAMSSYYGISPAVEHFTCMVDLFSRTGHFNEAMKFMKRMPHPHYFPAWVAILNACREWSNIKLGKVAFEKAYIWNNMIENCNNTVTIKI